MGEEQRYNEKENELLMLRSQVIEDKIVSKSEEFEGCVGGTCITHIKVKQIKGN